MAHRLKFALVLLCGTLATVTPAGAQSLTLGDLVAAAEYARRVAAFPRVRPAADAMLQRNVERIAASRALARPLAELVAAASTPDLLGRARLRQGEYDFNLPGQLGPVLDTIVMIVNGELRDAIEPRATEAEIARIRAPFDELQDATLRRSLEESAERLRRYEIMYGPGSVRLNGLEALLNYGAQWLPGFGGDPLGGPRPFELVAAYSSAYLTYAEEKPRMVSVAETGVRGYVFRRGWGEGKGIAAMLRPRHVAAGWAFAGPDDVPLQTPWRRGTRSGPFVSWGELKLAYLTGGTNRLLVTRQVQLIPLVF